MQLVGTSAPIGHFNDTAPVARPLGLSQILHRADLPHCNLGLVELRIERLDVSETLHPNLNDSMQLGVVIDTLLRCIETRISCQISTPHRAQVTGKRQGADQAWRRDECAS